EIVPPSAVPIPVPEILATDAENPVTESDAALAVIETTLGYEFRHKENLKLPLTHISTNPNKVPSEDSDRLETLGDKLLGTLVMAICYTTCPTYGAGELTNLTSMITCNDTFAVLAECAGFKGIRETARPKWTPIPARIQSANNAERMDDTESSGIFHIVNVPTTAHSIQPSTSNYNAMLDEIDPLSTDESHVNSQGTSVPDPTSLSLTALEEKIGY
ncbi:hypothetical protein DAPPUDRAFT_115168, partial [Daphnia pulex]